ncbi:hypothetical protein VOLCADRAFT_97339 [Volvox carteri f. nagariensis]|uniref:Uncharacterized protein n=1 Tax=Volvox carteri f. nagariensis TaxID=3068 RepID=D8UCH8_VOLCA|nr:uncharacterized protein VOLCADRAFT_97339 [Volvox carteri f. nagariensis]EFJ42495.1 hypothetical protein VOLCADRAFT_97339 [Volvox carteri f. nagariensis]|eukprot:XP_002956351.1 hypothetical protein VOLCADRAFT_97339 [Volvox carteri f. nagariensis]
MAEQGANLEHRPSKRAKNITALQAIGPDLQAEALLKYSLKLPQSFTPGAIQANRVALRVSLDLAATCSPSWEGVDQGKEGVLIPRSAQVGHVRQLELLSHMPAEVQGLYAGVHGQHHILAAVDAVGNTRVLAEPLTQGPGPGPGGQPGAQEQDSEEGGGGNAAGRAWQSARLGRWRQGEVEVEVAVARQRLRDVGVYRDGARLRTLHTIQVSLWDVRQGERGGCVQRIGVYGGGFPIYSLCWLSAAVTGSGGGGGGGTAITAATGRPRQQQHHHQGPGGGVLGPAGAGLLAAAGGERSVVVLEPRKDLADTTKETLAVTRIREIRDLPPKAPLPRRKRVNLRWHVVAKWPGCVKYPATHLRPSVLAPGYVYVAGLDYECAAGRWDGSCGSSTGNANSGSGGHGRAMGPVQLLKAGWGQQQQQQPDGAVAAGPMAMDEGPEGGISRRGGLLFRGSSKWLGLATCSLPLLGAEGAARREVAAALTLSGHLHVLLTSASVLASPEAVTA